MSNNLKGCKLASIGLDLRRFSLIFRYVHLYIYIYAYILKGERLAEIKKAYKNGGRAMESDEEGLGSL